MCLLFFKINPTASSNEYTLILINVRDETLTRPTKDVHFWENNADVIGAQDITKGKEGGTWLAMNKNGKIASLLNILQPQKTIDPNAKGRGFLVVDFVTGNEKGLEYLQKIAEEADAYNGFTQVTFDVNLPEKKIDVAYFTNMISEPPKPILPGFYAFGNSEPFKLWPKAKVGLDIFQNIIRPHDLIDSKELLVKELFQMLMNDNRQPVDEQMRSQALDLSEEFINGLSSIKVNLPQINYGSRTHTVILIDGGGTVDYYVNNLTSGNNPIQKWEKSHFNFKLNSL